MKNENSTTVNCIVKLKTLNFNFCLNKPEVETYQNYFLIYKTTNLLKNEGDENIFYVGKHKQYESLDFDGYFGSGKILVSSIKKYGEENFIRETLQIYNTFEEMNAGEIFWICSLSANKNEYPTCGGMNLTNGGQGHSFTDEQRENVRKRMMGEKNHFYGQHHTKEVKEYLSKLYKGIKRPDLCGENHADVSGVNNPKNKYRYIMSNNENFWSFFDKNERAILIKKFCTYKTNIITYKNITIQRFRKDEF